MNSVAPIPQSHGGVVTAGQALASIEANLLGAFETRSYSHEQYRAVVDAVGFSYPCSEAAQRALRVGVRVEEVRTYVATVEDALRAPPDPKVERAMIGILVDAFPSGRPANLRTYCDSLLYDVLALRYSPAVVAQACQTIRRKAKFLPAISELIEACDAAKEALNLRATIATRLIRCLDLAAEVVTALEPDPSAVPGKLRRGERSEK